jgi:hypothetical protein
MSIHINDFHDFYVPFVGVSDAGWRFLRTRQTSFAWEEYLPRSLQLSVARGLKAPAGGEASPRHSPPLPQ